MRVVKLNGVQPSKLQMYIEFTVLQEKYCRVNESSKADKQRKDNKISQVRPEKVDKNPVTPIVEARRNRR